MKLVYCPKCYDVVKLDRYVRQCKCGKSGGRYLEDGLNATYYGEAIPLGFANSSLANALKNQPEEGMGERFEAFVIPKKCSTMKKLK